MTSPIEELREALAKATPGPWESLSHVESTLYSVETKDSSEDDAIAEYLYRRDAAFIVAARNHLPALLAEYDRMEKENTSLRRIAAKVMPCHYCGGEDIGMCPSGFPGCALADDMMMGDEEQLAAVRAELAQAKATARRDALIEAADFVAGRRDPKGNLAAFAIAANHRRKMTEGEPTCAPRRAPPPPSSSPPPT